MSESAAAPAPPTERTVPAIERAAALLGTITTKILRPFDYADIADIADARAAEHRTRTVVVVGEVKRGKSFLVNALVGYRDGSPVGVDVTTSTTLSFTNGDTDTDTGSGLGGAGAGAGAGAELIYPDRSESIAHAELADWVSCEGARVQDARATELPTRAVVSVPGNRMGATTVIDTPGVGGLDPTYAALATAGLAQACVVVIVCDASTPLTAPEMEFITSAGAGVEALIVAVTKTDKNVRRWKPIVKKNTALLREHLGREIPVLGVSSLRAVVAAEMNPGPARESAEARSGITALRSLIDAKLAVADQLPAASGLRTAIGGLRTLAEDLGVQISAITDADRLVPDLTAQLDELGELKDHAQQWEQYLQRDLTLIRQSATDELDRRLDEIREKWTTRINKNGMEVLRRNPQHFTAEMERDFQSALAGSMEVFLSQLRTTIVEPRFDSEVVWDGIYTKVAETFAGRGIETHSVAGKRQGLLDPSMLTMGVMGSSMLGGIVGVSTVIGVGAVVGIAWVGVNLGFRAMRAGKTNLLTWMRETTTATKTTAARMFEGALALARPDIVIRYREHLKSSTALLQKQIKDAEDSARSDSATREKKLARLENNLKVVSGNITRAEALIAELTAPAAPPGGTGTPSAQPAEVRP
ncbi:hypothetical protein CH253_17635 [Rhodococcus sp. 06-156-3C]|uniref:dynamin family protein n=1 Tax=Nocardiaceae TaxID=85025 RepID=UPI00068F8100|nr:MULTISPECIES: dynamin family protein [Rhodococcus]OZD18286.1 hypothetical protein CH280_06960 [Rhodococcus sp. 06-156-4C]OZD18884.1 hypothetical protein CH253_17635 [Rhodococcus sp. 06-156-3C]OZD22394.1 hypothetical protein CH248_09220 [Rhodococcus sp. 06-156-4a]OZD33978.1 hypothetical protein CH247_07750 [Rhodococcus sp. 06-156-3b]OZD38715.1 hypothetical protein CH284_06170 [Rhodococcus sp. 06-156-3]